MTDSDRPTPKVGEVYQHFQGGAYKISLLSTCSETGQPLISYQGCQQNGTVQTRPLTNFMDILGDASTCWYYRFEKIENEIVIALLTNAGHES